MRQAWQYVQPYIESGLTASAALREYSDAGGHIRTQDWYTLWHQSSEASAAWGTVGYLKPTDAVPERLFEQTDIAFERKYVYSFGASVTVESGEKISDVYRYLESDSRLTWGEVLTGMKRTLQEDPSTRGIVELEIRDVRFFERSKD